MKRGFTLIELVIVIVILGILSSVAIPRFVDLAGQARVSATKGALGGLRSGVAIWYAHQAVTGAATSWPALSNLVATDPANTPVMAQGIPANPFITGANSTNVVETSTKPTPTSSVAWFYNSTSGEVWAGYAGTVGTDTNCQNW